MALTSTLDAVNEKLAKALGLMKEIEKSQEKINSGAAEILKGTVGSSQGVGGGKQVADASFAGSKKKKSKDTGGDGNSMSGSLGNVPAAGGTGGGTGGGTKSSSSSSSSSTTKTTEKSGTFSDIMAGSLAAFGAAAAGAYQGTPGVADAAAYKASTFLPAFTMAGKFNSKATDKRIFDAIGQGASGVFDAQGAASIAAASGFGFNMGKTLDNMLTASSFGYQMTGMSNQSAMKGQVALHQGTSGVSSKLAKIGIFTVGSNGKPKDMGEIVDDLWARFYGSKSAKISEEKFEADLAMGFLGADLAAGFGDQPELYTQIIALMRVKVKEGGRAGIRAGVAKGKNSATEMAKKHGMTEYNTPTVASGMANSARSKNVAAGTEAGLMNAFVNSAYIIEDFNNAMVSLTETLGPVAGILYNMKGLQQGVGGSEVGQVVSSVVGAVTSGLKMFLAPGGAVTGPGTSTSDSIPAMLSKDEFVVNARAASIIGRDKLDAINAMGHDFGSAFASPMQHLAGGTLPRDASAAVSWALGQVENPSKNYQGICDHFVGRAYGLAHSNSKNANVHWRNIPEELKHIGDQMPPAGALAFWDTGKVDGHVAIVTGQQNGEAVVTMNSPTGSVISKKLSAVGYGKYLGWTVPWFPLGGGKSATASVGNNILNPVGSDPSKPSDPLSTEETSTETSPLYSRDAKNLYTRDSKNIYKKASLGADSESGSASDTHNTSLGGRLSGASGPVRTNPVTVGGSLDEKGFATAILKGIGAGTTGVPLEAMMTWMRYEGGHWRNRFKHNPLNSSQNISGDDDNDPRGKSHINSYDDWQEGVDATLANLRGVGGAYKPIINALIAGKSTSDIYKAIEKSPWGTHNLPSASQGMDLQTSKGGLVQTHQNELIFPAEPAQDLRIALREFVSHARKDSQPITINLTIDKASDEEAERFAKKVIKIVENNGRMDRLRTR